MISSHADILEELESNVTYNNWKDEEGNHKGGQASGLGFAIAWQRGELKEVFDRNGAFLLEVLYVCLKQLEFYNNSKYKCQENTDAMYHIKQAIVSLSLRRNRREAEGILGKHVGESKLPSKSIHVDFAEIVEDVDVTSVIYIDHKPFRKVAEEFDSKGRWYYYTKHVIKDLSTGLYWSFLASSPLTENNESQELRLRYSNVVEDYVVLNPCKEKIVMAYESDAII